MTFSHVDDSMIISLFWADSESGLVERSDLNGNNRRTFIQSNGNTPSILIVDGDRVYWKSQLNSIGVDGQDLRIEIADIYFKGVVAFDVYKNLIFTTTNTQPSVYEGKSRHLFSVPSFAKYRGLAMHAQDKQPPMNNHPHTTRRPDSDNFSLLAIGIGTAVAALALAAILIAIIFCIKRCTNLKRSGAEVNTEGLPVTPQDSVAPNGPHNSIYYERESPECNDDNIYEEISLKDESYAVVLLRQISIDHLEFDNLADSILFRRQKPSGFMLLWRRAKLNRLDQQPTDIILVQPQMERDFAVKYLEGVFEIVEKLKKISNIEVPLGFVQQQGFIEIFTRNFEINPSLAGMRQPVLKSPERLLPDHLKNSERIYENTQIFQSDIKAIFCGIANGLAQLHEVGALVNKLNAGSVFLHIENGCLVAKLSSFSEASLVALSDRLDLAKGEREVRRLAPETLDCLEHTSKSDVWVMAILFWEIISGCEPYKGYTNDIEVEAAILGGCKLKKPAECKPNMYDLMNQCWMLDPENRPTSDRVALELPLMENVIFSFRSK
ncbi:hypothetical protein CAPTEDRAFT_204983 [Capitella teleta]|uniref:Protein kinase domain-containing protein n=1 Tax=Capitella teleta TaxID=283909 RepID=R7UJS8_CAPTE|nr:hypothetical protein CAPTEDRAFT_204983 [Capitella teleta]|eukprot:ELU06363.1 hypothetical protein CAPTEDRAFT_204983 [Capitella teleta]